MARLVTQDSIAPTRKVAAGGLSGSTAILIVYFAQQLGYEIPPEVASAATVLLSFAGSYVAKEKAVRHS